jgi:co-chaperonin GroES (HSP10)
MEVPQPIYDNLLVSVEYEWKGEVQGKNGIVGVRWETDIDRGIGAQTRACVVQVPRGISSFLQPFEKIEIGDVVYFHFNSISEDSRVQLHPNDQPLYLIHLDNIFCIVRNGKILMYKDRVFCLPVFDEDIETLDNGMKVKKTKSGIITQINVGHNMKEATLSHIGAPLPGEPNLNLDPGTKVFYEKDADFENVIEGTTYFCMIQEDLLMSVK